MAGKYSLSVEQGDTFNLQFQIREQETGIGWDLTGYTCTMQVKSFATSGVSLVDISSATSSIVIDNNGNINITINSNVISNLPVGRLDYEIKLISGGGIVTTILQGVFVVNA
jgi:hypothetical protein